MSPTIRLIWPRPGPNRHMATEKHDVSAPTVALVRIYDVPLHDRPRERLARRGAQSLSDRELVAIVLRTGRAGESALDLAGTLIAEFGGITRLASARPEELARHSGIGPAKAAVLAAAFRLGHLASEPQVVRETLRSTLDVARIAQRELRGARRERVIVLVCDAANRLVQVVEAGEGTIDRAIFPIREILNAVLRHDGRAFAVAHNHPSGDPTPSEQDARATRELEAGARVVGLRFIDHLVVGGNEARTVKWDHPPSG